MFCRRVASTSPEVGPWLHVPFSVSCHLAPEISLKTWLDHNWESSGYCLAVCSDLLSSSTFRPSNVVGFLPLIY
ncbi:hypothetical protein BDW62DRAFT_196489 [Aspergillus aurantiobrunneus]